MRRLRLGMMSGGELPLLLDLYPGASVAYSLRKLRKAYTGSAIRVRRASDNTEQNIGFDALGNLDTSALTAFCAGTNGFVTAWYDQSNFANNATQSSALNQLQIVTGGSVNTTNGKPSMFLGPIQALVFSLISPVSTFTVGKIDSQKGVNYILFNSVNTVGYFYGGNFTGGIGVFDGGVKAISGGDLNRHLVFYNYSGSNFQIGRDGDALINLVNSPNFNLTSIGRFGFDLNLTGPLQEVICYPTNQSSNRLGIETNINSFYNIYP